MSFPSFSTNLDFSLLVRCLLPGIIISFITTYLIMPLFIGIPLIYRFVGIILDLSIIEKILFWTVSGIFFGLILIFLDGEIYNFIRLNLYWPDYLINYKYNSQMKKYRGLINNINDINEKKIKKYPSKEKYLQSTDLGNVIAEYEYYSKEQYNMDFETFWSRIWYMLPEEVKKDIQIRGARADFPVYLSFIFLMFSPFVIIRILQCRILIYEQFVSLGIDHFYIVNLTSIILAISFMWMISFGFYKLAICEHVYYGTYIKSIFDIYRSSLAGKIGVKTSSNLTYSGIENERKEWNEYGKFWRSYILPGEKL